MSGNLFDTFVWICPGIQRSVYHDDMMTSNSLQWRHNDHDGLSNHQPHGCLLNRLFRRRSKKTSKLRVTGLCAGNWPGPVNSPHKGPVTQKCFHLMTSSCYFPRYWSFVRGIHWSTPLTKAQWRGALIMLSLMYEWKNGPSKSFEVCKTYIKHFWNVLVKTLSSFSNPEIRYILKFATRFETLFKR